METIKQERHVCGKCIYKTSSSYQLGQPHWSAKAYEDYMAWLGGCGYWKTVEASMCGKYGPAASEDAGDPLWKFYEAGTHEIVLSVEDGKEWSLVQIKDSPVFPNTNHDAFVDHVVFDGLDLSSVKSLKIAFTVDAKAAFDNVVAW